MMYMVMGSKAFSVRCHVNLVRNWAVFNVSVAVSENRAVFSRFWFLFFSIFSLPCCL